MCYRDPLRPLRHVRFQHATHERKHDAGGRSAEQRCTRYRPRLLTGPPDRLHDWVLSAVGGSRSTFQLSRLSAVSHSDDGLMTRSPLLPPPPTSHQSPPSPHQANQCFIITRPKQRVCGVYSRLLHTDGRRPPECRCKTVNRRLAQSYVGRSFS